MYTREVFLLYETTSSGVSKDAKGQRKKDERGKGELKFTVEHVEHRLIWTKLIGIQITRMG